MTPYFSRIRRRNRAQTVGERGRTRSDRAQTKHETEAWLSVGGACRARALLLALSSSPAARARGNPAPSPSSAPAPTRADIELRERTGEPGRAGESREGEQRTSTCTRRNSFFPVCAIACYLSPHTRRRIKHKTASETRKGKISFAAHCIFFFNWSNRVLQKTTFDRFGIVPFSSMPSCHGFLTVTAALFITLGLSHHPRHAHTLRTESPYFPPICSSALCPTFREKGGRGGGGRGSCHRAWLSLSLSLSLSLAPHVRARVRGVCFGLGHFDAFQPLPTCHNTWYLAWRGLARLASTILLKPDTLCHLIVIPLVCISDALRRLCAVPPCPPPSRPRRPARRPPYITLRRARPRHRWHRRIRPRGGISCAKVPGGRRARPGERANGRPRAPMYRGRRRFRRFSRGALFVRSSFFSQQPPRSRFPPCSATPSNPGSSRSCTASAASPCRSGIKKVSAPSPRHPPRLRPRSAEAPRRPAACMARGVCRARGARLLCFEYDVDDEKSPCSARGGARGVRGALRVGRCSLQRNGEGLAGRRTARCLRALNLVGLWRFRTLRNR